MAATAFSSGISATENFRRQHEELMALGFEINHHLDARALENEETAATVRRIVARFAGKLLIHAEMENKALYPRLLHSSDDAVRERAQALYEDVRRIYGAFGDYTKRWPTPASISARASDFVRETRDVLKLLGKRMIRENDELYPLADSSR
jgi:hypothetical protein